MTKREIDAITDRIQWNYEAWQRHANYSRQEQNKAQSPQFASEYFERFMEGMAILRALGYAYSALTRQLWPLST